jgi:eukaryotic-like serine/threonine-protein kinase
MEYMHERTDSYKHRPAAGEVHEERPGTVPELAEPAKIAPSLFELAKRHRWFFVAVAAVIVLSIMVSATSLWFAVRASRAAQLAETEARADQELTRFLRNDVLALDSPEKNANRELTLRTMLERAAQRIQGRFQDQPLAEAAIRMTLGETYQSLGESSGAVAHFRRAMSLYQGELGPTHRKTLAASRMLISALNDGGLYDEAILLGRQVLATHQRTLSPSDPDLLDAKYRLATPLFRKGERAVATQMLVETLKDYKRTLGPQHPDTLKVMDDLGVLYLVDGKPAEAQKLLLQALYLLRESLGAAHPKTITVMSNLAGAYADMSQFDQAERLMEEAVKLRQQILGPDHPNTLNSMNNLATLYADQGRFADSAELQARTIELGEKRLGAEHPRLLIWMNNLGMTYLDENKLDDAHRVLSRVLEVRRKVLGAENPDTLLSMRNLGFAEQRRGRLAEAEALLVPAWAASERVLGADSIERLKNGERLAAIWIDQGKLAAADSLLREVGEAWRTHFPDDWRTFATMSKRGQLLVRLRRYAEADSLLVDSYLGLTDRIQDIPENQKFVLKDTADSLFKLYAAWNQPEKRLAWEREFQARGGKIEGQGAAR